MAEACALVTFRCGHFAVVPIKDDRLLMSPTLLLDENEARFDLSMTPTQTHIRISYRSCTPQCVSSTLQQREARISQGIADVRAFLASAAAEYMALGQQYHGFHPKLRAWFVEVKQCELVHRQFGIETRSWRSDPFFRTWSLALEQLDQANMKLAGCSTDAVAFEAARHLNDSRALIGRVLDSVLQSRAGISRIGSRKVSFMLSRRIESTSEEKMNARRGKSKKGKRKVEVELRVSVFGNSIAAVWKRRMEGFANFVTVKS